MNPAISRISLDVHDISSQVAIHAKRGDTARCIMATLMEKGKPYVIAQDCSVEFVAHKPDGNVLKNSCKLADNVIRYDFTEMTVNVSGVAECEFRVFGPGGKLLTSPRFSLLIESALYNEGDAVEQESTSVNTVKSAASAYAEVHMWSDGNPDAEDRAGYFVTADTDRSGAMIKKAHSDSEIRGVAMIAPGFAAMAPADRFDESGNLLKQYAYVGLLGFVPVIDRGRCTVNGRCKPGEDGTAVQETGKGGYLVVERVDENHVIIMLQKAEKKKITSVITLLADRWEGNQQTVAVAGVTEDPEQLVLPSVVPEDRFDYWDCDICCKAQGDGTLTFECVRVPAGDITVNIAIFD